MLKVRRVSSLGIHHIVRHIKCIIKKLYIEKRVHKIYDKTDHLVEKVLQDNEDDGEIGLIQKYVDGPIPNILENII